MKTLGQGSLASLLKILLDIVYYLLWAVLGLASLIIVVIVFGGLYRFWALARICPPASASSWRWMWFWRFPLRSWRWPR